ncbi:hypothetical protein [Streptomyces griseocarneus]|uniref:hypothetical protein n=1 Tax=Streptomyces griseocarneus TaxID=51201 RepID=UPI00167C8F2B|nr:hypothetical protein [Streptomyces griseocarneus]MBZ6475040.1 hypothetical protein [Streptomyces griseocarneus]GHG62626.1 hypothetical protein GCM10018779_31470 [Streptomyces griseocarneus]
MSTNAYKHWQDLQVHCPGDVPPATPLTWLAEKHQEHADRLTNRLLPTDSLHEAERATTDDALAVLALREAVRREMEYGRGAHVRDALQLGATWNEVAAALDLAPDEAREVLRAWADGQRHLYTASEERGEQPLGLSAEQHATVLALAELGDDERVPAEGER